MVRVERSGNSPDTREEPPSAPRLLTLREVAYQLHAHVNSIRRWTNEGLLLSVRIGRRGDRRFRPLDVERFLEEYPGRTEAATGAGPILPSESATGRRRRQQ